MEQIAGDLLPAKNLDPLIASGYVRLGVSSNEGGTIPEELRVNIARERTEAFGATFMGLTVGCAVCHDHKYDPTTQKDFYALSAFFNNLEEKPFNDDRPVWEPVARIPKPQNQEEYNRVLAERSELAERLRAMRLQQRALVEQLAVVAAEIRLSPFPRRNSMLRLRLDEGGGDVLKNSAPHAQPASFPIGKFKPQWGETTWLWPDFRMDTNTHIALGQTGDYEWNQAFSSGGWFMLRSAPNYNINDNASGTLLSKMDSTQHNRGWDISLTKGIVSVELVNEGPKELAAIDKRRRSKRTADKKEVFQFPTPSDLTAKDLAPNKPKARRKKRRKETKKETKKTAEPKPPEDTTPLVDIRVSTVEPIPLDGHWRHIFFTYDGSGKASGVKIYVNGAPVKTQIVADTLASRRFGQRRQCCSAGAIPDANPARERATRIFASMDAR